MVYWYDTLRFTGYDTLRFTGYDTLPRFTGYDTLPRFAGDVSWYQLKGLTGIRWKGLTGIDYYKLLVLSGLKPLNCKLGARTLCPQEIFILLSFFVSNMSRIVIWKTSAVEWDNQRAVDIA